MMPLSRRSWQFSVVVLLVALVTAGLMLSRPAAAQESDQPHGDFSSLAGPFETPQEVTNACLECHFNADEEMLTSIHWTWEYTDPITGQQLGKNNVINNYCMAVPSNEPRCTSCHAGYGYDDKSFFETATAEDIDCLVCHDSTGSYKKFPTAAGYPVLDEPREFPPGSGKIWEPVDLTTVAQNVERPTRANCGSCHFFGGGGDAVKHGDLDSTLTNPDRELDVHMGTDSLDFSCVNCHNGDDHDIKGRVYNGEERVLCEDCHTGENTPHQGSDDQVTLNAHSENVACQTCHIPEFARGQPTKMSWDWSTAGDKNDEGRPYQVKNEAGQVVYDSKKGTFTWEMDVVPEYNWWNGNTFYLTVESQIDPSGVVPINEFEGARGDGKIYPFKRFTGVQPYDAGNDTLVIPNLFPNDAADTDAYWRGWDWQAAVSSGMAYAEADFSGELGWVDTEMFWVQNHMVAPADEALTCANCHTQDEGRIDFVALGYPPEHAEILTNLADPDALEEPPHEVLSSLEGPFETPQEVTSACLACHDEAGEEMLASIHWTWEYTDPITGQQLGKNNVINNYCMAVPSNEPRCTSCHAGYGYDDKSFFETATAEDIDCLVCHDSTGIYKKFPTAAGYPVLDEPREFPPGSGKVWEPVDLAMVAKNVDTPSRANCGSCHFFGGGGDAVKHGDLDSTLTNPDRELDVHMGTDSLDFSCVNCHNGEDHDIKGRVYNGDERVLCEDCHTGENAPHQGSAMANPLSSHIEYVACQTCHIPEFARGQPTKMSWDWSTAGDKNDEGKPYQTRNEEGEVVYDSKKGTFTWAMDVVPEYRWWNGNTFYSTVESQIDPSGVVPINEFEGARGDGKIYPFKRFTGVQPYDAGNETLVVPNLFPSGPNDTNAYWKSWDWQSAVSSGMSYVGADYSGELGWVETEMLWVQNHMVAPAGEALICADCHTRDQGRLDFIALGYSEVEAADLTRTATDIDIAGDPFGGGPQTQEERLEERRYAMELEAIQQRRQETQNLVLGVTLGIIAGLIVAAVLAVLILRSRGVTLPQARAWISEHRHGVTAILIVVLVSGLMGFLSIHYLFEFTASEEFCGELCHATRPESVTYHTSLHAEVPCVDCHVGEGLEKELLAKLNGIRELYLQVTNTYERPIPSPVETLRPARQVCETCHWPEVFYADRAIEIPHFANDEDNTRTNTYMLVKIGGGTERRGQGQGIHWHVENKVEYIATDPQRQNIPWVRAELGGETLTFVDVTNPLSEEELAEYEIREMDCIDCHNRASHVFRSPDEMLDEAMANGILPTDLPYLRREAYNAMRDQENFDEAMAAIDAIPAFYQENYPSVFDENQEILADVVEELKDMYATSHFPEARVDHTTYPDNLAHLEDPGCFRCHNGKHYVQEDGDKSIRLHCTICHTIPETVAADEPAPEIPFDSEPQPDNHLASTWVADHRYTLDETCDDCHVQETFCANENCHGRDWPYVNLSVSTPPFPLEDGE